LKAFNFCLAIRRKYLAALTAERGNIHTALGHLSLEPGKLCPGTVLNARVMKGRSRGQWVYRLKFSRPFHAGGKGTAALRRQRLFSRDFGERAKIEVFEPPRETEEAAYETPASAADI
jgi:hypothetical protein